MPITRDNLPSTSTPAVPKGRYEIVVTEVLPEKDPIEGVSEKDGNPYHIHNRIVKAQVEERISEDDEDGSWEAYTLFNGTTPKFTFKINVSEKYLDENQTKEFAEMFTDQEARNRFSMGVRSASATAQKLFEYHEDEEDLSDIINSMVGEKYVVDLSSWKSQDKRDGRERTEYNVYFQSPSDE